MAKVIAYFDFDGNCREVFPKLASGGTVNTELRVEFWSSLYGEVTGRFGTRWMLNFDMPEA